MNSLVGLMAGMVMLVGAALVFRYAELLAGGRSNATSTVGSVRSSGPHALHVALNRGVALGVALLGCFTIATSVL